MKTNGKKLFFSFGNWEKTYKNHSVVITIIRIIRKWMYFTDIYTIQSNSTIRRFGFVNIIRSFRMYCMFHCNVCCVLFFVVVDAVVVAVVVICVYSIFLWTWILRCDMDIWNSCHYSMLCVCVCVLVCVTITLNLNMFVLNLVKWMFSLIISSWDFFCSDKWNYYETCSHNKHFHLTTIRPDRSINSSS